ncbi:MAG: fibronectin type III domain-containing protein [bacterium]
MRRRQSRAETDAPPFAKWEVGYTCNGTPSHCTNGGPLNPPTGLTGTADGPNRVTVTFTDNSDNETGFHVERADGPCGSSSVFTVVGTLPGSPGTGSTVVFVDNTVQPGQTYCYQATAFNNGNESGPSNSATVTTPNGGVGPVGPGGPMFLEGSGGCSLSPFGSETRDVFAIVTAMMGTLPISIVRWTRKKKN